MQTDMQQRTLGKSPLRVSAIGLGLKPSLDGTGTVSRQDPPPGSVLPKGSNIKLFFEPPT